MRTGFWVALAIAVLALPVPAPAQPFGGRPGEGTRPGRGQPGFMAELFPPEIIMRNQTELGLSDAQRSAIMAAIRSTRDSLDPVHWELEAKQKQLSTLLHAPKVDEAAALAQADELMDLEKKLKKSHLLLLVKIKNLLTPEQQQKARALRTRRRGSFAPRGGPVPPGGRP